VGQRLPGAVTDFKGRTDVLDLRVRAGERFVSRVSVWAISRSLPGKYFLKEGDFSRGVLTQDGDHFLFADFVVAVAAFVDGLDDRSELFLRDHGLFFFWVWRSSCVSGSS
jgi:hypothetical protein